ncbi:sensor histidine kinase [Vaginisenegalia massiliensis]|uniref:sensor histidine kinase n=1 Tax=Vaginisenegalia massiliensis TaxID=2058294 RepID=UPI0013DDBD61|nr:HAMP domain-containing sensor histidine kinase [Vaginisenegalia massiliensis]
MIFNIGIQSGFILSANYSEKIVDRIEEKIKNQKIDESAFPNTLNVMNQKKKDVNTSCFSRQEIQKFENMRLNDTIVEGQLFGPNIYRKIGNSKQVYYVKYQLQADFKSPVLRYYLPNAEFVFFLSFFLIWLLTFVLITRLFSNKIKRELKKITEVNQEIEKLNLEMIVPSSKIIEVQRVLDSLNNVKEGLVQSLKKQWKIQDEQKILLQTLSHDIRTPITLVKGNLDLFLESENEDDKNRAAIQLQKGVNRMEELLYLVNSPQDEHQNIVDFNLELLTKWITEMKQMALNRDVIIKIKKVETSSVQINPIEIWNSLTNIVNNALDFSYSGSTISIQFIDAPLYYEINIEDEGPGFPEKCLDLIGKQVFSSRKAEDFHQGMGLYLSNYWLKKNKGQLIINNRVKNNKIIGAKVKIHFDKNISSLE